jgi:phosphoglycolate phosphatase
MNRVEHVIWDWNGTLVDDTQLCVNIVNDILAELRIPQVSLQFYRDHFSFPVRSYYEKIGLPVEDESYRVISEKFISEYRRLWRSCSLQSNASTVLSRLAEVGVSQSILSAAKSTDLTTFVSEFGLSSLVDQVTGVSNIDAAGKADISLGHLASLNYDPANILLVGDTVHDEEVATHMGVESLLFTGGHNSSTALKGCASELIDDLQQVLFRVIV